MAKFGNAATAGLQLHVSFRVAFCLFCSFSDRVLHRTGKEGMIFISHDPIDVEGLYTD